VQLFGRYHDSARGQKYENHSNHSLLSSILLKLQRIYAVFIPHCLERPAPLLQLQRP
jgi:hypothetical protein